MSIVNFFRRPHYTSDTTQFIHQLKEENPALDLGQRQGRALLWDRQIDPELQHQFRAAKVRQQPYVYQNAPLDR